MELHLGTTRDHDGCNYSKKEKGGGGGGGGEGEQHQDPNDPTQDHLLTFASSPSSSSSSSNLNLEHMFDKVVTPSDVGKLNRLVIPKQSAEKYFPLKPSAAAKGVQLTFEDRAGQPWEFRYSYWHSSQSYVMTRGWSRFVREKRLRKGDTVSFSRARGRLFIDCRRLPRPTTLAAVLRSPTNPGGARILSFSSVLTPPIVVGLVRRRVVDRPPVAKRFRLFGVDVECVVGAGEPAMI